jgi:hypothetical protein
MADDTQDKKQPVPYISWKTFTSFIGSVHGKVPAQVDASILKNMSGTARSQLLSALKFLNLTSADGIAQDSLKKLADAYNTDQWKSTLGSFIALAYKRVIADLNLRNATPAMLRDRFKNNGDVDGGTIDSAMRFYLSALKDAEVPFSEHLIIRQRAPRGSGTRKRASISKPASGENGGDGDRIEIPEGTFPVSFEILGLEGCAYLPEEISHAQWEAINSYVSMVIQLRQKAKAAG